MEIIIGVVMYSIVIVLFTSFGRFLKECDESMFEQIKKESLNKR